MDSDSRTLQSRPKRHQSTLQSRFDLYLGFEDGDCGGEEVLREAAEFACPFCSEDFDIVGLCCHIDEEHPVEAKNGVCSICAARVGMDLVEHITTQHANFFKMQRRRRFRRGSSGSHSSVSLLRRELREGNLPSLFGGLSYAAASSNAAPDPLLSSFITNLPLADSFKDGQTEPLDEGKMISKDSAGKATEKLFETLCS